LLGHPKIESSVRYLGDEVDDAQTQNFAETQNLFDNVTGFMHKSASFRSVFKSPARFAATGFVLGAAREAIVMAAILDQGAMAYVSLGRGCLRPRDFALSTYERKNPCKFPVVYRKPRFALSQVVLPRPAPSRPQRLNEPTPRRLRPSSTGRRLGWIAQPFFPVSANEANFRERSDRAKP
jgi:hypothetical protein